MFIAATAALAVLLAGGDQAAKAQSADSNAETLSVSVERVREGLERPPILRLPDMTQMGYFRVAVEEALAVESVLDTMRRDLAVRPGRPIGPPTDRPASLVGGVDLIGLARSFLRARAERNARRTVQEALDEFCSVHDCSVLEGGPTVAEGVLVPRPAARSSSSPSR
jgi:hypothetical protein